jgi:aminoglycoside phosphotransferase family enzyme/predicted kinase
MTTAGTEVALVQDLLRPDRYPPPLPAKIDLRTTHISWVFLTEDTAWKVKRPVSLGFVDFSTADARRTCCEAEVRLNSRLAPGIYQGVAPIHRGPAGHALIGPGPVIDFAVKMQRLPDQRSAAALLAAGRLEPADLGRLAARLARFYREAPAAPAGFDAVTVMESNVEENLQQLADGGAGLLEPERLARVADRQRGDLRRHRDRMRQRQAAGRVRDGHGDLRLEHVYFPEGGAGEPPPEPLVIDCVEFNARYRQGDVALDVAFLAMELRARDQPVLAEHFLYRFARESQDYDLYPLVDFFVSYRALVRAKIACLLARDPATSPARARRKESEAGRLLALADGHAQDAGARGPRVVLAVGGLVGTGKSTLAESLAVALGLPVVSSDATRKFLAGVAPLTRAPAAAYDEAFTRRTYEEVEARAAAVLHSGRGVVLDATFRNPEQRARARALAIAAGARFLFVETTCDEPTLRARLRSRAAGSSESDAGEAVLDRLRGQFLPPVELPAREHRRVDTTRPTAALVAEIGELLAGG